MRKPFFSILTMIAGMLLAGHSLAQAQQPAAVPAAAVSTNDDRAALEQRVRDLEDRLIQLEGQMRTLKSAQAPASAAAAGTSPQAESQPAPAVAPAEASLQPSAPPTYGGNAAAAKALNPDISIIGDFIGIAGKNSIRPGPALEMHESEIGMSAIIDPYARGDFFLSFGESGVNLEEGFLTLTSLPGGLLTKIGKMRAAFGKVNTLHTHVLPWADRSAAYFGSSSIRS